LSLLAICAAASFAQSGPEIKVKVDEIVSRQMQAGEVIGLGIGLISKGGQPQTFAYGEVLKRSGRKPSPSTLFQIGSITKTLTGVLLVLLAERGIVQLDDPLQKYVPHGIQVPSYNGRQILLVDLATHTSGLPRNPPTKPRQHDLSVEAMYQLLNEAKLTREPKQRYEYSNWGVALLAEALVRAAKAEDYQLLLEREVLSKLGMGETTLRPSAEREARVAHGYAKDGYIASWNMPTWPAFNGAGALYSTLGDMLKYLSFNLGLAQTSLNSVLSVVHQPKAGGLTSNHRVGLAWEIHDYPKLNLTIIGKEGGTPGFRTYIGFIRGEPTGVVVLANSVVTKSTLIGRQILALFAKKPEPPARKGQTKGGQAEMPLAFEGNGPGFH
jgi:CubicO group peptidase (beta-lactamase class C family)